MADLFTFQPDPQSLPPFQFQTSFAEGLRSLSFYWNAAGERWYMNIQDSTGTTLLYAPLIASPVGYDINLIRSISSSSLIYREANQVFEVTV
ncbi:hypothetical protein GS501_04570 [Saccharibacter sp. 17.LH.SD]|uniref:phage baseplate plug family protein n=1 Tax=Saccharibacter sp. 17.LH.SD TaxID=2689393 RepID=UPI00137093BD|nr:hypothetical protein [Saccharibacter sp. 17.LH.SD]MXV44319.1 hypothetical protein [Saccharibacter sp. 17.LH.SD]